MGFGSFKKFVKRAVGAQFGGITGVLGAEKIFDFINDPVGAKAAAKKQAAALRRAGRIEEAQRLEAEAARQQILTETAGFREQGRAELERLGAQRPGETEFFRQGLARGTESIAEQRARFGLTESGGTGRRFDELGSQLLLQEELNRQRGLQSAAALSQTGFGGGLQALQLQGAAAARQAQTEANIGSLQAQAKLANRQFYTGLGTQLLGGVGGYLLGGPAGAAVGSQVGGGATQGGYNLQYPQFNQFQPVIRR